MQPRQGAAKARLTVIVESNVKPSITQWSLALMARPSLASVDRRVMDFTSPECHSGILAKSRSCKGDHADISLEIALSLSLKARYISDSRLL